MDDPRLPLSKGRTVRNPDYRDWIRDRRCALNHICEWPYRVEPAHVKSKGSGGGDNENLVPLCAHSHQRLHAWGREKWEKTYGADLEYLRKLYWRRYLHERVEE